MTGKENLTEAIRRVLRDRKRERLERFVRPEATGDAPPADVDDVPPAPLSARATLAKRLDATIGVTKETEGDGGDHGDTE